MNQTMFNEGHIEYTSEFKSLKDFEDLRNLFVEWNDGFLVFSNEEFRVANFKDKNAYDLLKGRIEGIRNVEGYLNEINLWKNDGRQFEELVIEREDDGFYCQQWVLNTEAKDGKDTNCYCRRGISPVLGNKTGFFDNKSLATYEVITIANRLHFFITIGGAL
jgi:hypothetical protein